VLDLTQLRSFLEVAERGTVAAASAALGYTPPAVSQHVAKLERSLDAPLFERVAGRLTLTDAGRALVPIAREAVELTARAAEVVARPPRRPPVAIAGFASGIAALIAPNLARLRDAVTVEITEAEDAAALRELRLGRVDIAIVQEYPGDESGRDDRLDYTPVAADELRLVLPPSSPATTTLADLHGFPWLVNGTGTRCEAATRQILRRAGLEATITGDVSDNHLLLELVAAGHGATIVPDLVLADADANAPVTVTVADQRLGVTRTLLAVTRRTPAQAAVTVVQALTGQPAPSAPPSPGQAVPM
jgi:DNA-binding transcriptional LysR family regulator